MISKQLKAVIAEFAEDFSKYSTQAGALYQCCDATDEFLRLVREKLDYFDTVAIRRFEFSVEKSTGLYPRIYKMGLNEAGSQRADWHCIVNTKNVLIDWTAKQYVETAPFPLIIVKRFLTIQKIDGDYYKAIRPAYLPIRKAELLAKAAAVGHV